MSGAIIQTVLARELPARITGPNAEEVGFDLMLSRQHQD